VWVTLGTPCARTQGHSELTYHPTNADGAPYSVKCTVLLKVVSAGARSGCFEYAVRPKPLSILDTHKPYLEQRASAPASGFVLMVQCLRIV
jgi:hypothetical protein